MARFLSWAGVGLIVVSLIWWELLPRAPGPASSAGLSAVPSSVTRVIIDAGHGGNDSGAMRGGVLEKDLTLDVARRLDQIVRARGLTTTMTRAGDDTVSLGNRAAIANGARDAVFVSIHFDEVARGAATGVQTFYAARQRANSPALVSWVPFLHANSTEPNNLESASLAGFVQEAMVAQTKAFNRGTRAEQFYVVANVRHPAVLVEGGFLSNNEDLARLTSDEYRQQLAVAIGDGIMRYRAVAGGARAILAAGGPGG